MYVCTYKYSIGQNHKLNSNRKMYFRSGSRSIQVACLPFFKLQQITFLWSDFVVLWSPTECDCHRLFCFCHYSCFFDTNTSVICYPSFTWLRLTLFLPVWTTSLFIIHSLHTCIRYFTVIVHFIAVLRSVQSCVNCSCKCGVTTWTELNLQQH